MIKLTQILKEEYKWHKSPSGKWTNMSPNDDDYEINYGKNAIKESLTPRDAMRNVVSLLQQNGYKDKEEIIDTIMKLRQQDKEIYNKIMSMPNSDGSKESIEFLYQNKRNNTE